MLYSVAAWQQAEYKSEWRGHRNINEVVEENEMWTFCLSIKYCLTNQIT